jgi:hypothetical protein
LSAHTLLKQAKTRGTPSLGPSTPGIKSILGPIQLKGLTIVNSRPFSAPSAGENSKTTLVRMRMSRASSATKTSAGKSLYTNQR